MLCAILLFLSYVEGDWVEISPIRNGKNSTISTPTFDHTTPGYESIIKAPVYTNVITTTPAYENYEDSMYIEKQFMENNVYTNQSLFSEGHKSELPVGGFFAFLQIIQENLLKSASHSNKISVLKNLRDTLLANLYKRISILWKKPEKNENPRARGLKDDDHEMDFPSNEGALMTIGFLTFGVFLIKLVIKLVQALKYKYANSTTTTTTAATLVFLKRKKREEFTEKTAKITAFIEELPY